MKEHNKIVVITHCSNCPWRRDYHARPGQARNMGHSECTELSLPIRIHKRRFPVWCPLQDEDDS